MVGLFLSISFALPACRALWSERPYYDLYDEAINLYWKSPRDTEAALKLLRNGCSWNADLQDASCYNLGTLLELEGRREEALEAYRRAQRLRPAPIYDAAIQALQPHEPSTDSEYLRAMARAVQFCRGNAPGAALGELRAASAAAQAGGTPAPRTVFAQPFFEQCLSGIADYRGFLAQQPPASASAAGEQLSNRARSHAFAALWDIEFHMLHGQGAIRNPLTESWEKATNAAQSGNAAAFGAQLQEFQARLGATCAERSALERRCRAIRRAAGALILYDPLYAAVRESQSVRNLAQELQGR